MSPSLERLARSQALFREVNERIEMVAADNATVEFVCECSDTACIDAVELTLPEYERVRANSIWFVIRPGHDIPEIERVVSENGGHVVVEKQKAEGDLVEMDPRSGAAS